MKKMIVNCATCDMRKVSEETLQSYEQIVVNAATVMVTPAAKALMNRYNVTLNAAEVMEVPEGENVRVNSQNGSYELTGEGAPQAGELAILMVNGSLTVGIDALTAAQAYQKIKVNGSVLLPRSMAGKLNNLSVNGKISVYPDGAILLKRNAVIDRTFSLRAKDGALYWAARRLVFVDGSLDAEKLAAKGIRFSSQEALLAESLAERISPLLSDDTDITVVPDGTVFINDDGKMNRHFLKKYGPKVYLNGDLTVEDDAEEALAGIEYLHVNGDVKLPESLVESFEDVDAEYNELIVLKKSGKMVQDQVRATVDKALLEKFSDGITVTDCAFLKIASDVTPELILERLSVSDCGMVRCSPEQEAAVGAICKDVGQINTGEDGEEGGLWDMIKGGLTGEVKVVNAADYVM